MTRAFCRKTWWPHHRAVRESEGVSSRGWESWELSPPGEPAVNSHVCATEPHGPLALLSRHRWLPLHSLFPGLLERPPNPELCREVNWGIGKWTQYISTAVHPLSILQSYTILYTKQKLTCKKDNGKIMLLSNTMKLSLIKIKIQ